MRPHRSFALTLALSLSLLSLLAASAGAQEGDRALREARAYCDAHGLRGREVRLPSGQVRLVVPVTPATADDFARRFSQQAGFVRLREAYRHLGTFCFLSLEPGALYHARGLESWPEAQSNFVRPCATATSHYRATSELARANTAFYDRAQAFAFPVALGEAQLQHLKGWLQRAPVDPQVNAAWSNCMHYTGNAEVAPGCSMFQHLGISRSKDGPNILARLAHCAGANLPVVARYVQSQAELDALPEADLLGPKPVGKPPAAR